eukprot:TRINITY_DN13809_c0_g1_i1.p1 TRINITY_DN13809_c0_g1~~TRINITY_DN13809_c0_g1_i1.p1  ORF type:complete len:472 (-),score=31.06 TRINITY_DN13809_c0_g1_i1:20-1336(-)
MILWDSSTGSVIRRIFGHSAFINAASLSADGNFLVSGSDDGSVRFWDGVSGEEIRALWLHSHRVRCVAMSPDGCRAASAAFDGEIRLWDVNSAVTLRADGRAHTASANSICASLDGKTLVTASSDGTVRVWDACTGDDLHTMRGHTAPVISVTLVHEDEKPLIVSGSADGTLRVWDPNATLCKPCVLSGHAGAVNCVVAHKLYVASGSDDGTVRIWDISACKGLRTIEDVDSLAVSAVAFMDNGRSVLSGTASGSVHIWDTASGALLRTLHGHLGSVRSIATYGDIVASASDDETVRLWHITLEGAAGSVLTGHSDAVQSVTFSSDGRRLLSAGADGTGRVWDVRSGETVRVIHCQGSPVMGATFVGTHNRAALVSCDGSLRVACVTGGYCELSIQRELSLSAFGAASRLPLAANDNIPPNPDARPKTQGSSRPRLAW